MKFGKSTAAQTVTCRNNFLAQRIKTLLILSFQQLIVQSRVHCDFGPQ